MGPVRFTQVAMMNKQIILIADVAGAAHYHVGDEAILTSRLAWLRREFPTVEAVAVSEDPVFTARQNGLRALAEPELPGWADQAWIYSWRTPALTARYLEIRSRWSIPSLALLLRQIRKSVALVICGGGNLTTPYGRLLRFRSLLAGYAEACGVPVVVTGQQIGPTLTPAETRILCQWLPHAVLVGVRDTEVSARFGRKLGVSEHRLIVTGDDALDLDAVRVSAPWIPSKAVGPVIGLSLHNPGQAGQRLEQLSALASLLGPWLRGTNARVLMLPHLRASVAHRCDVRLAHDFSTACGLAEQIHVVDSPDYRDVHIKYLTGLCDFIVTTRFHGAVFALTTGVPLMALSHDTYADSKFNGLFSYFGLDWQAMRVTDPKAVDVLHKAWNQRAKARVQLDMARQTAMTKHGKSQEKIRLVLERLM